jgi:hypothetical protein
MYNLQNLKTLLSSPTSVVGLYNHFGTKINQLYYNNLYTHKGSSVTEEEWDNLIILDGCRYDLFESVNSISGDLESRTSAGTESAQFLRKNYTILFI